MGMAMQFSHKRRAHKEIVHKPPSPILAIVANPCDGGGGPVAHISSFFRTASTRVSSFLNLKPPSPPRLSLKIQTSPIFYHAPFSVASPPESYQSEPLSTNPFKNCCRPSPKPGPEFPSGTRISTARGGEPAFVGRVYSIYNDSDNDIIDASSHIHIPFLSERTPKWLKEMFAATKKTDKNGAGSRFFVHWDDAVSYLQERYVPNGFVGNCDLDSAYDDFKEKPHLVQFVSNKRQVKEANKLLKTVARCGSGNHELDGVPVFTSQNLDLVIETTNGIKRYIPYFFDKKVLDNILDDSTDNYYETLISKRYTQRLGYDDHNQNGKEVEEMGQSMWDHPRVQEALHKVSGDISLSDITSNLLSKLSPTEVLYAVDKVLLGNRWLRKATGIQPKFPYVVDSFERKSAASFVGANNRPSVKISDSEFENAHGKQAQILGLQFPFGDWLEHPWSSKQQKQQSLSDTRKREEGVKQSRFLPKVTIVDISTEEPESRNASSQKIINGLMERLEQQDDRPGPAWTQSKVDERDPIFVADFEELAVWYSFHKAR